jgi:rhodanese-related sulfurtransferase
MGLLSKLFGGVPSVTVNEAKQLVSDGAVMVDVRTTAEWNAGHYPHAIHVEGRELAARQRRIPKGKRVVVTCRSGSRSRGAVRQLIAAGYDAVNLSGGMSAWQRSGERLVDRAGRPGQVR